LKTRGPKSASLFSLKLKLIVDPQKSEADFGPRVFNTPCFFLHRHPSLFFRMSLNISKKSIEDVPADVMGEISKYMDVRDILALQTANHSVYMLIKPYKYLMLNEDTSGRFMRDKDFKRDVLKSVSRPRKQLGLQLRMIRCSRKYTFPRDKATCDWAHNSVQCVRIFIVHNVITHYT
jgi:hypothetical protein